MIKAVAKKRLAFHDDEGSFITVKPFQFVDLPDYVRKDPMFAWAVKDGSLVVSEQVIVPVEEKAEATAPAPKKKGAKK
jgi:hypothetical protein